MMNYKATKEYIGSSDIASLTLRGVGHSSVLYFGEDGSYSAYIVRNATEIPSHYSFRDKFASWLWIYDDEGLVKRFEAEKIEVYRAGDFGCLINLIDK